MTLTKRINMKKLLIISLLVISSCVVSGQAKAVKDGDILTRKDTLTPRHYLTHSQTLEFYSSKIKLGQQERELQQKYGSTDSLGMQMKMLEGKKEELYKSLLPNDKYQLYKQKKLLLLSSGNEEIK